MVRRPLADKRPFGPIVQAQSGDSFLNLGQGDRDVSPLVLLREFKSGVESDLDEQTISTMFGTLKWSKSSYLSSIKVTWGFHESQIENNFNFRPMGSQVGGGTTLQGTPADELGGKAGEFAKLFKDTYDSAFQWEFEELDAASVGHENYTDYEFAYSTSVDQSEVIEKDPGQF